MRTRSVSRFLIEKCVYLALLVTVIAAADDACDKTKCPGPLQYYNALGCTPVYKNPGDCCAVEYNCDHLKTLSKEKCYVNGKEYNVGEELKIEDSNPCDRCVCVTGSDGVATFRCAIFDCFPQAPPKPGCYRKNSPDKCCPGPYVCLEDGEERPTCEVDGVTYKAGDYFQPKSDPDKKCYCMAGYKGENVEPFCKKPNRNYCSPLFKRASDIHANCTPTYYSNQSPQTDCNVASRCQNENDTVIHNHDSVKSASSETGSSKTCQFGDMTMQVGDELDQGTDYSSVCMKCVCEIPPTPTCQRLPDEECDVTKHQHFGARLG